jgi:hypothetical protein
MEQATGGCAQWDRVAWDVEERAVGPKGGALVGRYGYGNYAATVFGRSRRDTNCDCSASNEPNLLQAIYTQNDKDVVAAIGRKGGWLSEITPRLAGASVNERDALIQEAYLRTLSRPPALHEVERCKAHFDEVGSAVEGFQELLWVLLNSREFLTNH